MSRWGKTNLVVPLDTLLSKENKDTSRPIAARSFGTVGRWGKMGFTSTRTYALKALPSSLSPAGQSPEIANTAGGVGSASPVSSADPPKPKKFFKSRNTAVSLDLIRSTFMQQHMAQHQPTSPGYMQASNSSYLNSNNLNEHNTPNEQSKFADKETLNPFKLKLSKKRGARKKSASSVEKIEKSEKPAKEKPIKEKPPPKEKAPSKEKAPPKEKVLPKEKPPSKEKTLPKEKPPKKEKKKLLKPETAPSRVLSRSRKTVNYNEDDDSIPYRVVPQKQVESSTDEISAAELEYEITDSPSTSAQNKFINSSIGNNISGVDHPPIVLRISKGTSRLISTDSEDLQQQNIKSPTITSTDESKLIDPEQNLSENQSQISTAAQAGSPIKTTEELLSVLSGQETKSQSDSISVQSPPTLTLDEINYEAKISPDKPPKERLKLIIKTDVLKRALAAEAEKAEKKNKSKKHHHHHHHHHHKNLTMKIATEQFKTPSPQPGTENYDLYKQLTVSPLERDFDSQSSILGSVSSKANHVPGIPATEVPEDQCVIRSRGSSDVTSDLETSQHSSLVAPPSDIELRLESMMDPEDDSASNKKRGKVIQDEPLKEDILTILTGGNEKENKDANLTKQPVKRGRGRKRAEKLPGIENESQPEIVAPIETGRKLATSNENLLMEIPLKTPPDEIKSRTRRGMNRTLVTAAVETETKLPERKRKGKEQNLTDSLSSESELLKTPERTTRSQQNLVESISKEKRAVTPLKIRGTRASKSIVNELPKNDGNFVEGNSIKHATESPASIPLIKQVRGRGRKPVNKALEQLNKVDEKSNDEPKKIENTIENSTVEENVDTLKLEPIKIRGRRGAIKTAETETDLHNLEAAKLQTEPDVGDTPIINEIKNRSSKRNLKQQNEVASNKLVIESVVIRAKRGRQVQAQKQDTKKGKHLESVIENIAEKAILNESIVETNKLSTSSDTLTSENDSSKNETSLLTTLEKPIRDKRAINNQPATKPNSNEKELAILLTPTRGRRKPIETKKIVENNIANVENDSTEAINNDTSTEESFPISPNTRGISRNNINKITQEKLLVKSYGSKRRKIQEKTIVSDNITDDNLNEITENIKNNITSNDKDTNRKGIRISKFKRNWLEKEPKSNESEEPIEKKSMIEEVINNEDIDKNAQINDDVGDQRSVKLVISKKKGSIFKSRALVTNQVTGNNGASTEPKKRHVYKHKWDIEDEIDSGTASSKPSEKIKKPVAPTAFKDFNDDHFDEDDDEPVSKFTRITRPTTDDAESVTSLRCDKSAKDFYTVVRNVKTAHQIQEIGEYQEMDDDIEYILDALQIHNPIPTRCLSALQLATKCMTPAFRMHVRAHGTVTKFFKALRDAKSEKSLALCTSAIMFVLSQDTLNMDLDRDSLKLMINLLETDSVETQDAANHERSRGKVREICEDIKGQGKATHLHLDAISAGSLAMETLLSMTSKRAGEWFKEELRELGGLEHIIKTVCDCFHQISDYVVSWTDTLLEKLRTIERCLRVLENVSQVNERNQKYILNYENVTQTLFKLYKLCDSEIALYPTTDSTAKDNPGVVLREALVPTLKVLINLTHSFDEDDLGSSLLGQREGIFDTSFHILLQAPNYVPERCIFELSILVLLLLINLTTHTAPNRKRIMNSHAPSDFGNQFDKVPAIKALIEYFYRCEEQARTAERNTDAILENPEKTKSKSQEEVDETVTKLLQKAGHHMEHTLQASYAGILIGHLISDSEENEKTIRFYLKENKFSDIVSILEKYYNFMNLTASNEASVVAHIISTKKIIDYFQKCDSSHSNQPSEDEQQPSTSTSLSINSSSSTSRNYKTYSQR